MAWMVAGCFAFFCILRLLISYFLAFISDFLTCRLEESSWASLSIAPTSVRTSFHSKSGPWVSTFGRSFMSTLWLCSRLM
ncbi:hypothetical protein B0H13DRAFT_926603 [Mycena leptocephala]|nr:hypothetical protein B0H13DRAFT_926603 [Mycena leptocephala]